MAYTTINKSTDHFITNLWDGDDGANRAITTTFEPSWVWIKARDGTYDHGLYDQVRGATKSIHSNTTVAEHTTANGLKSFTSTGFTIGGDAETNDASLDYVSWSWKANGQGSANTDGSISSTVSANTTAGFSIVKWTGSGLKASTVGHGLGVKPDMIIARQYSDAKNWFVYHKGLTDDYTILLNLTEAQTSGSSYYTAGNIMKSASSPDTSTFSFNGSSSTTTNLNTSGSDNIAYCFAEKKGFSKFGKYTGTGSDLFIYTGFKPALMICKKTDSADNWKIVDNKRSPFNVMDDTLAADTSNAEASPEGGVTIDFLSNGFAFKSMSNAAFNASGGSYIYMAFAEAPLVGSNNVPCVAR